MLSPDDRVLEELLFSGDLGVEVTGAEVTGSEVTGSEVTGVEVTGSEVTGSEVTGLEPGVGSAVVDHVFSSTENATAVSVPEPLTCAGCGQRVSDRYFLLAAGGVWHDRCLRCSQCDCELQTHASLYCRDGNIYCQHDYCRVFGGGQCARCLQPIAASALVMRSGALTFHPHCFSCQECDLTLTPGKLYCVQGRSLYSQTQVSGEGEESVSSPEPRLDDRPSGGRSQRRSKRIRTCFRSEQLRALESHFARKHNPDGKDWTGLVHETGLPKRVLQVWFQNARAKLRRSLDSQANSPSAAQRSVTTATGSPPRPYPDQSQPFSSSSSSCFTSSFTSSSSSTSTIDQLQLSLLTAPLADSPLSPAPGRNPAFFLDYDSQNAPGCAPSLEEAYEDCGGGAEGGAGGGGAEEEQSPPLPSHHGTASPGPGPPRPFLNTKNAKEQTCVLEENVLASRRMNYRMLRVQSTDDVSVEHKNTRTD